LAEKRLLLATTQSRLQGKKARYLAAPGFVVCISRSLSGGFLAVLAVVDGFAQPSDGLHIVLLTQAVGVEQRLLRAGSVRVAQQDEKA
jgi:hypothetical protein